MRGRRFLFRQKLALTLLVFSLLPLSILGTLYMLQIRSDERRETLSLYTEQLRLNGDSISDLYLTGSHQLLYLSNHSYLREVLNQIGSYDLTETFTSYESVNSILSALESNNDQSHISIFAYDQHVYDSGLIQKTDRLDVALRKVIEQSQGDMVYKAGNWQPETHTFDVMIYKLLQVADKPEGIIRLTVPASKLAGSISMDLPKGAFAAYVHDEQHIQILKANDIGRKEALQIAYGYVSAGDQGPDDVIIQTVKFSEHQMILFLPEGVVAGKLKKATFQIALMMFAAFLIIAGSVMTVTSRLTFRLKLLINRFNRNIDTLISTDIDFRHGGGDEFAEIHAKLYEFLQEVRTYHQQSLKDKEERKKLQLQVLQEQINPHFLYNTLSAIKWAYPDPDLGETIDAMVRYYRGSLSRGREQLTVEEEFELISQYLKLQKFAYDSDFIYEIRCQPGTEHRIVSKMLLQPIVENAVLHGINGMSVGGGRIVVEAEKREGFLVLTVKDNGNGIPPEKLAVLEEYQPVRFGGYGLRNVRQRLQLYYGDEARIHIHSRNGEGTEVTLYLPDGNREGFAAL
ncbi:sensor histidine kinase [Paenibacillus swuensis]|uniref:sensor histidine kinase n=1 Tax=Paenibacillus swuensis TaxID=1178515 RepID=UPI00083917C9|nr:histidine kinase [Paenibacillus swuensis]